MLKCGIFSIGGNELSKCAEVFLNQMIQARYVKKNVLFCQILFKY